MALNTFPTLPGLAWSTFKQPAFTTRIQRSVNGVEWTSIEQSATVFTFTLTFDLLRDDPAAGLDEYNTLRGFFLQQQGAAIPFIYNDPTALDQGPYIVRFCEDLASFEKFMIGLWRQKQIKFQTALS